MKLRPAFTLIEIMIVIAIVMILASAAVLQTSSVQNMLRFNNSFSKIILMVQRARNLTFTEQEAGTNFGVYIEGTDIVTGRQKITLFADRDGNDVYDPLAADGEPGARDEKLENAHVLPEGIRALGKSLENGESCNAQIKILFESKTAATSLFCNEIRLEPSNVERAGQLEIRLSQPAKDREKCFVIALLSGIPQIQECIS